MRATSLKEKVEALQALKDSFAYCADALKTMDDAKAVASPEISNAFLHIVVHNNEIYGNVVGYLRSSGVVPPSTAALPLPAPPPTIAPRPPVAPPAQAAPLTPSVANPPATMSQQIAPLPPPIEVRPPPGPPPIAPRPRPRPPLVLTPPVTTNQ